VKILLLHNRYQQPGGEDEVFHREAGLLRRNGHEVVEYEDSNDRLTEIGPVQGFVQAIWSRGTVDRLRRILRDVQPQVAHFHNTFAMISPAAYYACGEARVPVVQTLHNYRHGCANASCAVDGEPCERCISLPIAWPGIVRKCYRGSRTATVGAAAITSIHKLAGTYRNKVDAYISTTAFARGIHIRSGLPEDRIFLKPNFTDRAASGLHRRPDCGLFVGRLTREKGIDVLLEAARILGNRGSLQIAGDGPEANTVREAARVDPCIEWHGTQSREAIARWMLGAGFLIHPSRLYEGCGMVLVEAFSAGLPSIVSGHGSLAELVQDGGTGLHFRPGDASDLAMKIEWMRTHPAEQARMGVAARAVFEARYTPEENYRILMGIYQAAIDHARCA
jgi:glycosyltransferase involved in cell wall biosynthesis